MQITQEKLIYAKNPFLSAINYSLKFVIIVLERTAKSSTSVTLTCSPGLHFQENLYSNHVRFVTNQGMRHR